MYPESSPDFWRSVKAEDNVILGDEMTRRARMEDGKGPSPESYRVSSVMAIRNKLAEWRMFTLDEENKIYLLAKIVDTTMSLYVFTETDWEPATRAEAIKDERTYIFENPPEISLEEILANTGMLKYVSSIEHSEIEFFQKPQGEQNGTVAFSPIRSGVEDWQATIVEYAASAGAKTSEKETLLIEAGTPDHGVIRLYMGRTLGINDVKVMKR